MKLPLQARQVCCTLYVVLHVAAHYSARWFEVMPGISIWYAPCGLAMGLLLLLGPSAWPVVFAANLVTAYLGSGLPEWWAPLVFPALVTGNYAFFAWLARKTNGSVVFPDSPQRVASFVLLLVLAPAGVASLGTWLLHAMHLNQDAFVWRPILRWWLGDFCGLLTVVPAVLVFGTPLLRPQAFAAPRHCVNARLCWLRISLMGTILLATLGLVFGSEVLRNYNAFYICFVPLILICMQYGLPGATLATLAIMMGGLLGIHHFGDGSLPLIINFLLFMIAVAGVGLGLGSAVSSRNAMQQRFLKSQKMESLGVLAGGIAHDFNNLLTIILGNATLAKLDAEGNSSVIASLDQVEIATRKASDLCQQMLVYAGKAPVSVTSIDLFSLAENSLSMMGGTVPPNCRLQLQPAVATARIKADEHQLRQVIITLLINAVEAIGDKQGVIRVRTERRRMFKDDLRQHQAEGNLEEGDYAIIEIEDTGCGMPPEVQSRIFEPFFSTKFIGKGMGLAAVLGIVKANRGGVAVRSELGVGTRFQLVFPATAPEKEDAGRPSPLTRIPAKGGTVLLVEDDGPVRALVRRCLGALDFTVIEAGDGLEGVELFERHQAQLCCVIMDLAMPRMDGAAAFAEMHRIDCRIPVILMSAYDPKHSLEKLGPLAPAGFIAKPFDFSTLERRLSEILARPATLKGA